MWANCYSGACGILVRCILFKFRDASTRPEPSWPAYSGLPNWFGHFRVGWVASAFIMIYLLFSLTTIIIGKIYFLPIRSIISFSFYANCEMRYRARAVSWGAPRPTTSKRAEYLIFITRAAKFANNNH